MRINKFFSSLLSRINPCDEPRIIPVIEELKLQSGGSGKQRSDGLSGIPGK